MPDARRVSTLLTARFRETPLAADTATNAQHPRRQDAQGAEVQALGRALRLKPQWK